MPIYLYEVTVNKFNTDEFVETFHIASANYLQACHTSKFFIFDQGRYPNFHVEVVKVSKVTTVKEIINYTQYIPVFDDPFNTENYDESAIIKFTHSCGNILSVVDTGWEIIECPDCNDIIRRDDLENVGGMWLFTGDSDEEDGRV